MKLFVQFPTYFHHSIIFTLSKRSLMNNEEIREYCLSKPGVTESLQFSDTTLVFKVMGKMFALLDL